MANIKCKKCKNIYETFIEVEIAEERLTQIQQENAQPKVPYAIGPNFCRYCKCEIFYIDEEEIMQKLTKLGALETILTTFKDENIEITEELTSMLEDLYGASITQSDKKEIKEVIDKFKEKEEPTDEK